jgi:hypothetical protein
VAGKRLLLALALAGCEADPGERGAREPGAPAQDAAVDPWVDLRAFEERERAAADFAAAPARDALGADPYSLVPLSPMRAAGILRGGELALYDAELHAIARTPVSSPTGLAACDGSLYVVGELDAAVARYRAEDLAPEPPLPLPGAQAPRAVACRGDTVYVADEAADTLTILAGGEATVRPLCRAPIGLALSGDHLLATCLVDHALAVVPIEEGPAVTIRHDGPIWGAAAHEVDGVLEVALGGIEDHPLDRGEGFFGHIDSFVFLYRVRGGAAERVAERNVSADGVVTPKALLWEGAELVVAGYGSARAVRLDGSLALLGAHDHLPGATSLVRFGAHLVAPSPLLDGWIVDATSLVAEHAPADPEQRLGEALAFTTLMAPDNASDGPRSRFSCEACHFEGYVDGRTHRTGRGDVRATTKPLYGLFNNKPHFTRALDRDLTTIADAEFAVAGRGNPRDPWSPLRLADHRWLGLLGVEALLGVEEAEVSPLAQRRALMRFLMAFRHRESPFLARGGLDARAREGAEIFRARCEGCHAARLSTDDPASRLDFADWEASLGAIVWASDGYRKTGVEPYVHPEGARTSSLRRLYRKRPYFTNGSAPTLEVVLERAALRGDTFFHDGAPAEATRLDDGEREALLAFLRLL